MARVKPIAGFGVSNIGVSNIGASNIGALIGLVEDVVGSSERGCWPDGADRTNQRPGGDKLKRACWPEPEALRRSEPAPADRVRKATRGRLF